MHLRIPFTTRNPTLKGSSRLQRGLAHNCPQYQHKQQNRSKTKVVEDCQAFASVVKKVFGENCCNSIHCGGPTDGFWRRKGTVWMKGMGCRCGCHQAEDILWVIQSGGDNAEEVCLPLPMGRQLHLGLREPATKKAKTSAFFWGGGLAFWGDRGPESHDAGVLLWAGRVAHNPSAWHKACPSTMPHACLVEHAGLGHHIRCEWQ